MSFEDEEEMREKIETRSNTHTRANVCIAYIFKIEMWNVNEIVLFVLLTCIEKKRVFKRHLIIVLLSFYAGGKMQIVL